VTCVYVLTPHAAARKASRTRSTTSKSRSSVEVEGGIVENVRRLSLCWKDNGSMYVGADVYIATAAEGRERLLPCVSLARKQESKKARKKGGVVLVPRAARTQVYVCPRDLLGIGT
jgi:hypothetical protein